LVGEPDRWLVKEIMKSSKEPVKCRVIPTGKLIISLFLEIIVFVLIFNLKLFILRRN
jgi:hypothetical protein